MKVRRDYTEMSWPAERSHFVFDQSQKAAVLV